MISIFSIISAFLIWHNWQSSWSFSPQAELGHQHNPLSCFQMTQFSSIIAQIPLNVSGQAEVKMKPADYWMSTELQSANQK